MRSCNSITDKRAVAGESSISWAELTLEAADDKFRSLLDAIDDGYCELDLAGDLTFFNDRFCRTLETDARKLLGANLLEFMAESDAKTFRDALDSVCCKGGPAKVADLALSGRAGTKRSFCLLAALIRNPKGEHTGFWCLWRDITALKMLEDQLCQNGKMEAIGHLVGSVAHDFNNLLTAIMGFSDMLEQQIPKEAPYRDKATQIGVAARRASDLTRQLLVFSRRQTPEVSELNLNVIILEIESIFKRLIGEDIELVTVLSPYLEKIKGDRCQIEQILLNLVINARDAMPTGGKLMISTSTTDTLDDHSEKPIGRNSGRYVMLTVSDDGDGIDSCSLPKIFDPFFSTKQKGSSVGLGLATVDAIVKQHSGHIRVVSEPSGGTVFTLYFPSAGDAPEQCPPKLSADPQVGGKETVLVVEDEQIVLEWACEVLRMLGYTFLAARDPGEAIRISHTYEGDIHLLLTDVVLPRMDGPSLSRRLFEVRPGMKALYMSGYDGIPGDRYEIAQAGGHFLRKPFTLERLAKKIRAVLDESPADEGVSVACAE